MNYYICTHCQNPTRQRDCVCDACHVAGKRTDTGAQLDQMLGRQSVHRKDWKIATPKPEPKTPAQIAQRQATKRSKELGKYGEALCRNLFAHHGIILNRNREHRGGGYHYATDVDLASNKDGIHVEVKARVETFAGFNLRAISKNQRTMMTNWTTSGHRCFVALMQFDTHAPRGCTVAYVVPWPAWLTIESALRDAAKPGERYKGGSFRESELYLLEPWRVVLEEGRWEGLRLYAE